MSTGRETVQPRHGQTAATEAALTATLGLAAASRVVAVDVRWRWRSPDSES
jgi:hypothetical protein